MSKKKGRKPTLKVDSDIDFDTFKRKFTSQQQEELHPAEIGDAWKALKEKLDCINATKRQKRQSAATGRLQTRLAQSLRVDIQLPLPLRPVCCKPNVNPPGQRSKNMQYLPGAQEDMTQK